LHIICLKQFVIFYAFDMNPTELNGICRGCMKNNYGELKPLFKCKTFEVFRECTYLEVSFKNNYKT